MIYLYVAVIYLAVTVINTFYRMWHTGEYALKESKKHRREYYGKCLAAKMRYNGDVCNPEYKREIARLDEEYAIVGSNKYSEIYAKTVAWERGERDMSPYDNIGRGGTGKAKAETEKCTAAAPAKSEAERKPYSYPTDDMLK